MKIFKRISLAILSIFLISSVGGYIYFDKKFTPPDNYLTTDGVSGKIPLKWISNESNPNVAILLPVKLEGISKVFYMQLDFGSPITLFYLKTIGSIKSQFSNEINLNKNSDIVSLKFDLGKMTVSSDKFKVLSYGEVANLDKEGINIIGTIGTDLLEKKLTILNFKDNYCLFSNDKLADGFTSFDFKKRKILLPAKINGKDLKLLYDSGTSGYDLITDHSEWDKYRLKNERIKTEKGNSWGNTLTVNTAPAKQKIEIGNKNLNLTEVTYIEGTSKVQNLLMKLSGMQGMIGNKLFLDHQIIIDCKNEKFKVE